MSARSIVERGEAIYQARWLTPDGEHLLSPGCIHVRDGCIVRVWEGTDATATNLGDAVITPGLINAHTHLEFSDLRQPLAPGETFPDWIRTVIQSRRSRTSDAREAIRSGWRESCESGVVGVGEIATTDESFDELSAAGAAGVVFREVLGLQEEAVERGLETARAFLSKSDALASRDASAAGQTDGQRNSGPLNPALSPAGMSAARRETVYGGAGDGLSRLASTLQRGLSPHAPYSLHPRLFRSLIDLAVETGAPVAMHLAETREELELIESHCGGLVDLLRSLGLWQGHAFAEFRRPLGYLRELSRCSRVLVVHGNYLNVEELDFLATQPHMSVVYCPRTHAAFGHAPHPWRAMQSRGIRVVLGTDSRASNPDLSLVGELRFLKQQFPCIGDGELLRMVTAEAAESLRLSHTLGSLEPGKLARFTAVSPMASPLGQDLSGLWG